MPARKSAPSKDSAPSLVKTATGPTGGAAAPAGKNPSGKGSAGKSPSGNGSAGKGKAGTRPASATAEPTPAKPPAATRSATEPATQPAGKPAGKAARASGTAPATTGAPAKPAATAPAPARTPARTPAKATGPAKNGTSPANAGDGEPAEDEEVPMNRAARRAKGRGAGSVPAGGRVALPGRGASFQAPRQWTKRRGG